jgi:hypothetical protein
VRLACERRHYNPRTAKTYVFWVRCYILFHAKRHPRELGTEAITAFLNHLAGIERASASTQSQALLGHRHLETTMNYTHFEQTVKSVESPLDRL